MLLLDEKIHRFRRRNHLNKRALIQHILNCFKIIRIPLLGYRFYRTKPNRKYNNIFEETSERQGINRFFNLTHLLSLSYFQLTLMKNVHRIKLYKVFKDEKNICGKYSYICIFTLS